MARFPAVLPPRVWSPPRVGASPELSSSDLRALLCRAVAAGLAGLVAVSIIVLAGHAATAVGTIGTLLPAVLGTGALAAATTALSLVLALPLTVALASGRLGRLVVIAASVPVAVPAVALATLGVADGAVALVIVQALVFAPAAALLLKDRLLVSPESWDASAQFGATRWQQQRATLVPELRTSLPAAASSVALLAIADIVAPVVLAPSVPTLGSAIWQRALAGDFGGAALAGTLLTMIAAPLLLVRRPAIESSSITPASRSWSLVVSIALLLAAGAALAVLAGATLASQTSWLAWPIAVGIAGALAGSALGSAAAVGLAESPHWPRFIAPLVRLLPLPASGLAAVLTVGGALGGGTLVAIVAATAAFAIATRLVQPAATIERPIVEAAGALGGSAADLLVPSAGRRIVGGALRTAGQTIGGGMFVVLAGVDHPAAIALLPNAAAALVIGLFAIGCTLAAQTIEAEVTA